MSQQPANVDLSLEEQLVAYLDGELDAETSRRIEELLATNPKARQTLQGLDRTWELLSELERPEVAERFTQSTLEMVTVAAAEDTERSRTEASRRRRWRRVTLGGSLLAAAAAGFLGVALRPDPNRQLIDDLPVLENLDEYRQIDDIEFLRMLQKEGVFAEEGGNEQ
jgi:anti-sigma factor RsiW